MDERQQTIITAALSRGNTPGDSASLAGITEAHFWREYVQGQEDVEKGNATEAASFYLAASQAEAQFADELVTRALGEDSTKEVLAILQARNAAWGRREDYERRKQQEESRRTGPPIFTDPLARALMGAMAAIIDGENPQEQDWEKRFRLGQLREAHQVLTADIERRELELEAEPVGAAP